MNLMYKAAFILALSSAIYVYGQPLERTALPQDTVARIGMSAITARDLLERLELMPFPRKEKPSQKDSAKTRALLGLIAEKVLANEARRLHLAENSTTVRMREGLEDLFIRDELFKREVVQKVNPTEEEIYTGLQRLAVEQKIIVIMTDTEVKCKMITSQLQKKVDLKSVLHSSEIQEVDTINVTYGALEPDVEQAIFTIGASRVSRPLYRPQSGWVVFYLLERHANPAIQKMDLPSRRSHVEKIIKTKAL